MILYLKQNLKLEINKKLKKKQFIQILKKKIFVTSQINRMSEQLVLRIIDPKPIKHSWCYVKK